MEAPSLSIAKGNLAAGNFRLPLAVSMILTATVADDILVRICAQRMPANLRASVNETLIQVLAAVVHHQTEILHNHRPAVDALCIFPTLDRCCHCIHHHSDRNRRRPSSHWGNHFFHS